MSARLLQRIPRTDTSHGLCVHTLISPQGLFTAREHWRTGNATRSQNHVLLLLMLLLLYSLFSSELAIVIWPDHLRIENNHLRLPIATGLKEDKDGKQARYLRRNPRLVDGTQ